MVRYAKLPLLFDAKATQHELLSADKNWQSHFNTHYFEGSWTVLALRSPDGNQNNIIPDLITGAAYRDTLLMEQFPSVKALLSKLDCQKMAVRFLNLKAGAIIKPHRDNELAFELGEARLHFPIITNPDVEFYSENDRIILSDGDCWYLNANLTHRVFNGGTTDRIHLVVDCKVNTWLAEMINSSTQISRKENQSSSELLMIIKQLRFQNTASAIKLANEMEQQLKQG